MIGFEDCESLFTHLKKEKAIAGKYMARHFLGIQKSRGAGELGIVYRLPGLGNPADWSAKVKSDMARESFDCYKAPPRRGGGG